MTEKMNYEKMHNMPKKSVVITIIIATLSIIATTITFYPFFNPKYALYETNKISQEFILTKFDLFNPTYTIIDTWRDSSDTGERTVTVARLNRNSLFSFEVDEILATGKSQNANFNDVKRYAQETNLSEKNPEVDVFIGNFPWSQNDISERERDLLTGEEGYYLRYSEKPGFQKKSVDDFKQLKKGMTWSEVNNAGIFSENIHSTGYVSGKYERRARVKNSEVLFVVMAFAEDVDDKNPNAPLEDVYIVYLDRSVKKLDLESK